MGILLEKSTDGVALEGCSGGGCWLAESDSRWRSASAGGLPIPLRGFAVASVVEMEA